MLTEQLSSIEMIFPTCVQANSIHILEVAKGFLEILVGAIINKIWVLIYADKINGLSKDTAKISAV